MSPLSLDKHPIELIAALKSRFGSDPILRFARYHYVPELLLDERQRTLIPIDEVTPEWLLATLSSLAPEENFALESVVDLKGETLHIPMLDLDGLGNGQLEALKNGLREQNADDGLYYFSGRSFHAYFPDLIDSKRWSRFMGEALLCSSPGAPSAVDARWVGHRLMGLHSALRWSFAGSHYKAMPTRVDSSLLDHPDPLSLLRPTLDSGRKPGP